MLYLPATLRHFRYASTFIFRRAPVSRHQRTQYQRLPDTETSPLTRKWNQNCLPRCFACRIENQKARRFRGANSSDGNAVSESSSRGEPAYWSLAGLTNGQWDTVSPLLAALRPCIGLLNRKYEPTPHADPPRRDSCLLEAPRRGKPPWVSVKLIRTPYDPFTRSVVSFSMRKGGTRRCRPY